MRISGISIPPRQGNAGVLSDRRWGERGDGLEDTEGARCDGQGGPHAQTDRETDRPTDGTDRQTVGETDTEIERERERQRDRLTYRQTDGTDS